MVDSTGLELHSGSRVAVIGGGPAGSFFSYFLLDLARRLDIDLNVDIWEPHDYLTPGPRGCNNCAGIISESLVQMLAAEGINLPPTVVRTGIEHYVLYTPEQKTRIWATARERRIGAVFRGAGPKGLSDPDSSGFDGYLLQLAVDQGASHVQDKIMAVAWQDGLPALTGTGGRAGAYDLVVVASGLNLNTLRMFDNLGLRYRPPATTKSHIREFLLGEDRVAKYIGNSIHVFLLNIRRIEFAALVPKGAYVTLCLVGQDIDGALVESLLSTPQLRECLPEHVPLEGSCRCSPNTFLRLAVEPFADRLVFIGDCAVSRLYKDGIGAAYRTAKAAATTALLHGVTANDFQRHYWRICRLIENDNRVGRIVFRVNEEIQKRSYALGGLVRMVEREQRATGVPPRMSGVVWDTFTGSAPYKDIFKRTLHPAFLARYLSDIVAHVVPARRTTATKGA